MVLLIVTDENSGMDRYSRAIAERLHINTINTKRYLSLAESYRLGKYIRKKRCIAHLPNQHFARYALFLGKPYIVTVHDLARLCFNSDDETLSERLLLKLDSRYIRRASHIIAVSQNTKRDLVKYLGIPEDKISVIYNGVDHEVFRPRRKRPDNPEVAGKPYILYVGSERRRKNLGRLLEAFANLKGEFGNLKLVKVGSFGRSGQFRDETMAKIKKLGITGEVVFVDEVSDVELARYYSFASLLAYPSIYEGFGLPPVEAMACGCPVITSNTSCLPEVVGQAGIMVDPYDTCGMAHAMRRIASDEQLRDDLKRRGFEQSKKFSWERAARLTLRVYQKVIDETTPAARPQTDNLLQYGKHY